MTVFYRVHPTDAPPFNADNAWSALWGRERSEDGSKTRCSSCDGTGEDWRECPRCHGAGGGEETCTRCDGEGHIPDCATCDGDGWEPCVRGYSCMEDPEELIEYFTQRDPADTMAQTGEQVIVFEGQQVDTGFDDEPTAIPERVIETMPWVDFVTRHAN